MTRTALWALMAVTCAVLTPLVAGKDVHPDWTLCYICESPDGGHSSQACLNGSTTIPTVNCSRSSASDPEPRCFKTLSSMVDNMNGNEYTVVRRGCDLNAPWNGCETSAAPNRGRTAECYCHTDKCNGSSALSATWAVLLVVVALMLIRA